MASWAHGPAHGGWTREVSVLVVHRCCWNISEEVRQPEVPCMMPGSMSTCSMLLSTKFFFFKSGTLSKLIPHLVL